MSNEAELQWFVMRFATWPVEGADCLLRISAGGIYHIVAHPQEQSDRRVHRADFEAAREKLREQFIHDPHDTCTNAKRYWRAQVEGRLQRAIERELSDIGMAGFGVSCDVVVPPPLTHESSADDVNDWLIDFGSNRQTWYEALGPTALEPRTIRVTVTVGKPAIKT